MVRCTFAFPVMFCLAATLGCKRSQPSADATGFAPLPSASVVATDRELGAGKVQTLLTEAQWRQFTSPPYVRDPFRHDPVASRAYYEAFLTAERVKWKEPGVLALPPTFGKPRTLNTAAYDAGWSAAMTGEDDQLTDSERAEIERLKAAG